MPTSSRTGANERRLHPDRRACPTTLLRTLRWRGQRQGFRRAGDGRNAYVDCPTLCVVGLVVFIVVSSLLDAWLTLVHLQQGGQETNPVMALALVYGNSAFVGTKMALSGAGAWWLAAHQQFPLAMRGLYGMVLAYVLLLCYHGMLVFS